MPHPSPIELRRVRITGGFWAQRIDVNREATLPIELQQCETTGRIDALRLAWKPGDPPEKLPHIFWDSDVAKWIEAAAYSLATHPDARLEAKVDEVVELLAASQQPDGYINSHYSVAGLDKRWTNLRDNHELYCAGHLIEAAVAYFHATAKTRMLDVLVRYVDYIATVFGPGEGQKRGYCGHEEIELALVKLHEATGEKRFLDLATYFVNERGARPHYFDIEAVARGEEPAKYWAKTYAYCQADVPVRELRHVEGHAVRAMYLYTAMADLARLHGDAGLAKACDALWNDVTRKKTYVTGGLGPSAHNEGFTTDYDLPNESAYAETCAAVGLVYWAERMMRLHPDDPRFADTLETCLYNGTISGVSLDGQRFFYVNPLESRGKHHRQPWFGCACCPPNIARLIASVGRYFYSTAPGRIFVNLYNESTADIDLDNRNIRITQDTQYPWAGTVNLMLEADQPHEFTLSLRIPGWARSHEVRVNGKPLPAGAKKRGGHVHIRRTWASGDKVRLTLPMPVERIEAHPQVRMNCGRVALRRGPVVYCLEEADNGPALNDITLPAAAAITARFEPRTLGGVVALHATARRRDAKAFHPALYQPAPVRTHKVRIKAIPYFAWDNRKAGEMLTWINAG